ncbi:hypothetical protein F4810DRAFT_672612 [Camillea tinctor]|nr:hypothetical protein F4810DRAFT_672612 [Camillea tinctor]
MCIIRWKICCINSKIVAWRKARLTFIDSSFFLIIFSHFLFMCMHMYVCTDYECSVWSLAYSPSTIHILTLTCFIHGWA